MRTQHARPFSRREFLGGLTSAGTAGFWSVPWADRRRAAARNDDAQAGHGAMPFVGPSVCGRSAPPGRGVHRGAIPVQEGRGASQHGSLRMKALASGETDLDTTFAWNAHHPNRGGGPDPCPDGGPRRLPRALRDGAGRTIRDLRGKTVDVFELGGVHAPVPRQHGVVCGPGPPQGPHLGQRTLG